MMIKRIFSIILVILWLFVIYAFSDTAGITSGEQARNVFVKVLTISTGLLYKTKIIKYELSQEAIKSFAKKYYLSFRKFCHFFVYFMLGLFSYLSILVIFNKNELISSIITICFSFSYSIFDEIHQSTVVGRNGSFLDCIIDVLGATFACLLISLLLYYRKKRNIKKS